MSWKPRHDSECFTEPGQFAKRLHNQYGIDRQFNPVQAYFVINDKVEKHEVVKIVGADTSYYSPDYAVTTEGKRLSTFYMFPVRKHKKPELRQIEDDLGKCTQWVAPWKKRVLRAWD